MKLKEVIEGDFRVDGTKEEAQRYLKKIPILNKVTPEGQDVSLDSLERLLVNMLRKHDISMRYIMLTIIRDEVPWYSVSFKDKQSNEWIHSLYAISIYELYCKSVLYCYALIKRGEKEKDE